MTTAIFGLVGVVIGGVLSALLNYLLQSAQDRRRWEREDQLKFEPERLALYRNFLNGVESPRSWDESERERLSRILSEMELLSSKAVHERAWEVLRFAEKLHSGAWRDDEERYDPEEKSLRPASYRLGGGRGAHAGTHIPLQQSGA